MNLSLEADANNCAGVNGETLAELAVFEDGKKETASTT